MYTWTVFKGSADGTIKESISTSGPLQDNQVLVAIVAAGLCGTDTHQRHSDMVLGHEGVGMVQEIGPNVRSLRSGDRVGWGYQHGCCHSCKHCLSGREMYCPDAQLHGVSDLDVGAFATHAIWTEPFLIRIPDGLSSIDAAPIMCAGITVYSALKSSSIPFGGSVGIIGMGGLGHLAIQFAAKQGCRVAVFSHNEEKRGDALDLGAHEFHVVDGTSPNKILSDGIDILLVTDSRGMGMLFLPFCNAIQSLTHNLRLALLAAADAARRSNSPPFYPL